MKKNILLTFVCSLVPGCGQMYQGYMKRGLSLLTWFSGVIAIAALFYMEPILFALPVIWAYSFFDTYNLRNLSEEQRGAMGDYFIPNFSTIKITGMKDVNLLKVIGWGCVGFGALILLNMVWDVMYSFAYNYAPWLVDVMYRVPALCVAAIVIIVGLRLLLGNKKSDETNDMTEFKGGEDNA